MAQKMFYKILSEGRKSAVIPAFYGKYSVTYPKGKWAKPIIKGTRLMVFEKLQQATLLIRQLEINSNKHRGLFVVPCEVKDPKRLKFIPHIGDLHVFPAFWKEWYRAKDADPYCFAVEGTYAVKAVKCLE